jgi:hypothetical protein
MNINGIDDTSYISETDYYHKVELILNNKVFNFAYCDKNNYHKLIDNSFLPQVYVRNIEGSYYNSDYKNITNTDNILDEIPENADKLIVKTAVGSCGGKSIQLLRKEDDGWFSSSGEKLSLIYLENIYRRNFLIQEFIRQHHFYSKFNETSVNTIRLFTYRSIKNNDIIVLQSMLRIGKKGSSVDNVFSGEFVVISSRWKTRRLCCWENAFKLLEFNSLIFKDIGRLHRMKK